LAGQTGVALENSKLYKELQKSYFETIRALVNAIEAKDKYTKGHSEKVTQIALLIAEKLGLTDRDKNILKHAAILHDIGKIGIDLHILQKKGTLTPEERAAIEEHPLIGEHILEPIEFLKEVREIIHQHHERIDGRGYPNGVKGNNLSLLSKILTIADAYEAMSSDRPYRKAMNKDDIIIELNTHKGTQFDSNLVDVLVDIINRGEDIPLADDFWESRGTFLM
jgi:putative nucleotidyltransferase with HDIG domain